MRAGWSRPPGVLALSVLLAAGANAQEVVDVRIENYRFNPPEVAIHVGDTVRLPIGGVPESERMFPDESWSYRFERAGRYEYHCGPHPEMTGVIRVGE